MNNSVYSKHRQFSQKSVDSTDKVFIPNKAANEKLGKKGEIGSLGHEAFEQVSCALRELVPLFLPAFSMENSEVLEVRLLCLKAEPR